MTFESLSEQWAVRLTSFRRDGTPVGTAVSIAFDDGRAFVRSPATRARSSASAVKRHVEVAPCTVRGRPTGPPIGARATRIDGADAERAARALRRKHPVLQGVLVPLAHRVLRCGTAYFELRPD